MEKFLIRYKMTLCKYMRDIRNDNEWNLIFVKADTKEIALETLKKAKEYSSDGGDSAFLRDHEFVETIETI